MKQISYMHNVLYVFHPVFLRSVIKRNINGLKFFTLHKKVTDSLSTFTPYIIPFSNRFLIFHKYNIIVNSFLLKYLLRRLKINDYILWIYDPEAVAYLDYLEPLLSCYDCVDDYSAMPYYNSSPKRKRRLENLEKQLIERCDLIFATSNNLYEQKRLYNSNTFLVENVGDFDHFNKVETTQFDSDPLDFPNVKSPIIGFVGAIDNYKVDFNLIEYLADKRPDWAIVLIGAKMNPDEKKINFPSNSNIFYLGIKEYEKLPNYIAKFDACIIPYRINKYTECVFPIKFFEFLATGKPIVTTALPALNEFREVANITNTYDEFISALESVLSNDTNDLKQRRINVARNNTWESRKKRLLNHVYETLEAKSI